MKIGRVTLQYPFVVAPMAGMTDSAFRRLVKRQGGCGLVVTEMVSSEGLVRGIDRTLEYAEYTEEERPVSIQIFGGDPDTMAAAAQIVEGMGADMIDVNMGCPVPKIAKHNAGCSLMREPEHAATVINRMAKAVKIPVTVKMRAGWNDRSRNAPELARRVQDAGAAAVTIHGRTAEQSYSGSADWDLVSGVARDLTIPVLGSGDCIEPQQIIDRLRHVGAGFSPEYAGAGFSPEYAGAGFIPEYAGAGFSPEYVGAGFSPEYVGAGFSPEYVGAGFSRPISGVLVGRGVLRNPWILAQAGDLEAGHPPREVTLRERGQFLLDYIDLLVSERVDETEGFRHSLSPEPWALSPAERGIARGRERWVINKLRALCAWYSKGFDCGSHLRVRINSATSIQQLRDIVDEFFFAPVAAAAR